MTPEVNTVMTIIGAVAFLIGCFVLASSFKNYTKGVSKAKADTAGYGCIVAMIGGFLLLPLAGYLFSTDRTSNKIIVVFVVGMTIVLTVFFSQKKSTKETNDE